MSKMFVNKIGKLTIIGTIHASRHSENIVNSLINRVKPGVVAVELCEERYLMLKNFKGLNLKFVTKAGFLCLLIWLIEHIFSLKNKSVLGTDMLQAIFQAKQVGARIEFIDMPISRIVQMLKSLPLKEKLKLIMDSLSTIAIISTSKKVEFEFIELDDFLKFFKNKYPFFYECLIDKRDEYMARKLKSILSSSNKEVVAVVGLAHLNGISKKLKAMV